MSDGYLMQSDMLFRQVHLTVITVITVIFLMATFLSSFVIGDITNI